jgi:hypothetical protein
MGTVAAHKTESPAPASPAGGQRRASRGAPPSARTSNAPTRPKLADIKVCLPGSRYCVGRTITSAERGSTQPSAGTARSSNVAGTSIRRSRETWVSLSSPCQSDSSAGSMLAAPGPTRRKRGAGPAPFGPSGSTASTGRASGEGGSKGAAQAVSAHGSNTTNHLASIEPYSARCGPRLCDSRAIVAPDSSATRRDPEAP